MKNIFIVILFFAPLSMWAQKKQKTLLSVPYTVITITPFDSTHTFNIATGQIKDFSLTFSIAENQIKVKYDSSKIDKQGIYFLNYLTTKLQSDTVQKLNKRIEDLSNKLEVAKLGQQMGDDSMNRMLRAMYDSTPVKVIEKILEKYYQLGEAEKK